jgi:hypothetical protein
VVQKRLSFFSREELEKPQGRLQEDLGIFVFQVCSRQEVRADHLQTVTSGFVAAQHQGCRFDRLLNDRQLGSGAVWRPQALCLAIVLFAASLGQCLPPTLTPIPSSDPLCSACFLKSDAFSTPALSNASTIREKSFSRSFPTAALQEDAERSPDIGSDPVLQRRLTEELRKAEDGFLEAMK